MKKNEAETQLGSLHVVGAAIVSDAGACLAALRGPGMSSAGKWEFPGGKVEPREARRTALAREIREELGIEIEVGSLLGRGEAQGANRTIVLDVFLASIRGGTLTLHEHADICWLRADELENVDWADADRPLLPALEQVLRQASERRTPVPPVP